MKMADAKTPKSNPWKYRLETPISIPQKNDTERWQKLLKLAALLIGAEALVILTFSPATTRFLDRTEPAPPARIQRSTGTESGSRVMPFTGSAPLQPGDMVVVNQNGTSTVRKVASAPNAPLLLKRGDAVQGFYLLGKGSYVVMSGNESKVVSKDEIYATIGNTKGVKGSK
jgi:hypothetical protein